MTNLEHTKGKKHLLGETPCETCAYRGTSDCGTKLCEDGINEWLEGRVQDDERVD